MQELTRQTTPACKKQTSVLIAMPMLSLCGCEGVQSSLHPRGPHAQAIADIGWLMFGGAAAILLLVMTLALYAIYRPPAQRRTLSSHVLIAVGGLAFPVVTLSLLLGYGVTSMAKLRAHPVAQDAASIEVVGNRWWWDVHYRDADGSLMTTANEVRIPAGVPVTVVVRSDDVIHSFWVPNLTGKVDLIPGRRNHVVLHADMPGSFRGQCAEFCGAQHARMAFHVIAETPEAHAAWQQAQRAPARAPTEPEAIRGREAFISAGCVACHTVRGVGTARASGPDLTHVGSRSFIAAGTLENTRDNLADYIARSQVLKPGSGMPLYSELDEATLDAIAAYLESLE